MLGGWSASKAVGNPHFSLPSLPPLVVLLLSSGQFDIDLLVLVNGRVTPAQKDDVARLLRQQLVYKGNARNIVQTQKSIKVLELHTSNTGVTLDVDLLLLENLVDPYAAPGADKAQLQWRAALGKDDRWAPIPNGKGWPWQQHHSQAEIGIETAMLLSQQQSLSGDCSNTQYATLQLAWCPYLQKTRPLPIVYTLRRSNHMATLPISG